MTMLKSLNRDKLSALSRVLTLLALLLALSTPLTAGAATPRTGLEGRYDQAKVYHRKVAGSKSLAAERQNWLTAIRNFRNIYQNNRSHRLAPPSLLRVGLIYQEMFDHFNNPLDLGEAIAYYEDLISLYSKSRLADDALFAIANIYLENRQAEKKATRLLKRLIKRYPNGDMVPEALTMLAKLGVGNSGYTPVLQAGQKKKKSRSKSRATANKTSRATIQAELKPIRHWSNKNYTRVVIETTAKVEYKENLLKKTANAPRRLYIDLENCQIAAELQDPIPVDDGLLKRVRSGQHSPTTARVVLDTESLSDYKIFTLHNPFRIVIDVMGQKPEEESRAAEKTRKPLAMPISTAVTEKTPPPSTRVATETKIKSTATSASRPKSQLAKAPISTPIVIETPIEANAKIAIDAKVQTAPPSLAQQLGLGIKRIVLDPGHGGKDSGARGKNGLMEKDIVLKVAKLVAHRLKEKLDCEVIMTRDRDVFIPLEERTAIANTSDGDLFISIHVNAARSKKAHGTETYILDLARSKGAMELAARENSTSTSQISDLQTILLDLIQNSKKSESIRLAEYVHDHMVTGLRPTYKVRDLGVKQAPFIVLIGAQMPAILTEIAFISNPTEAKWLRSDKYISQVSEQLTNGISNYVNELNLAYLKIK